MELVKTKYKKTEVGLIPEDWSISELDELTSRIGDGIHTTPNYSNNSEYYFINGNNLGDRNIIIDNNTKKVSYDEYKIHKRELNESTILLSINGTIGSLSFYKNERIILGKSAAYLNLNTKINRNFLYFFLQTPIVNRFFENELTGSTIKNLGLGAIRKTPIPLPPTLEEQKAIADALSDVDALITNLEKLIEKKKAIKQGAMQQLLTAPNKGGKRLAGFSGEWVEKKLIDVCEVVGGSTPSTTNSEYWNGEVNWFTPSEMGYFKYSYNSGRKISTAGLKSCSAKLLPVGTVLMTSRASIGDLSILKSKACTNQGFQSLVPFNMDDSEFIYYLMFTLKSELLNLSSGSTFLEISPSKVKSLNVIIPKTIEERIEIAKILTDMDSEIEHLNSKKTKCNTIKQGMMQELLTGKTRLI